MTAHKTRFLLGSMTIIAGILSVVGMVALGITQYKHILEALR